MNTRPSPDLPDWALRYFERHRERFDDPEELPHRRDAFYRLLCASDAGMRRMWERADQFIARPTVCHFVPGPDAAVTHITDTDMGAEDFIGGLIFAADETIPEASAKAARQSPERAPRLRDPICVQARKLARLLREWRLVTPPRCIAKESPAMRSVGGMVEGLVHAYNLDIAPADLGEIYRRNGIEYTADSKRGWRQRRRASDAVRAKVIAAATKLAENGRPQDAAGLVRLIYNLRLLPDMEAEHVDQPEMFSQKAGWADWLRVAHSNLVGVGERAGFLRYIDWAALVLALFGNIVTEERIGQVLRDAQSPTPLAKISENPS